jgi:hypothetical protein
MWQRGNLTVGGVLTLLLKANSDQTASPRALSLRCPGCGHQSNFAPIHGIADLWVESKFAAGQRRCPKPECQTLVFVIATGSGDVVASYPPQRLDFDPAGIPPVVLAPFEEALACQAVGCHIAAAMLARKTLEAICEERGATGTTLRDRLTGLKSRVVLPSALFDAMDALRLLGNDAAHVESKTYDTIGDEEVRIALLLTKEILKATYQLDSLVSQLKALTKP